MQVGDLVLWDNKELGLIVDIDPLREDSLREYDKINEIVSKPAFIKRSMVPFFIPSTSKTVKN